jgi:hypothetical protein
MITRFILSAAVLISTAAVGQPNSPNNGSKKEGVIVQSTAQQQPKNSDTSHSVAPRNAKYLIISYGSNPVNPLKIGYFMLTGSEYTYFDMEGKQIGEGTYAYDNTEKQIRWQSGPFKAIGWGGEFETDNNGRTHNIRLKSSTIGTNTVE